jgi:hypothetical protein
LFLIHVYFPFLRNIYSIHHACAFVNLFSDYSYLLDTEMVFYSLDNISNYDL